MPNHPTPQLSVKSYFVVFGWLLGLTVLEVGIVLAHWPQKALIIMLVSTALAKATLIALYFMHLKFDRRTVWILPGIPVLLGLFFVGMLFPDLVFHLAQRV